ncbi:MAG: HEAT repeat domain-containing protein [Parachlamydiaceae bacterium]|nr:HEAT repeat domain-containing protein [Parachlamydiaceae bacterium]
MMVFTNLLHAILAVIALLISTTAFGIEPKDQAVRTVRAHLIVQDPSSACEEAKFQLAHYSKEQALWDVYIFALAKARQERALFAAWNEYKKLFPNAYEQRDVIENMAWGVIENGTHSPSPIIRAISLLGAFFGQDAKGIVFLRLHMQDKNSFLRGVAVQLAAQLRDASLCEAILHLLKREKVWSVRLEAIKAVGKMKIHSAKNELIGIISSEETTAEEKAAAIQSLVTLLEVADRNEIEQLARSNRAGLRLLACEVVAHCELANQVDLILPLLQDHHSEVRASALAALGLLHLKEVQGQSITNVMQRMTKDPDPTVAITAAWGLTLLNPQEGQKAFASWVTHPSSEIRVQASAALGACGKYANPYLLKAFNESQDPYVRMNLAIALIGQRIEVQSASQTLYQNLIGRKERWMWKDFHHFHALAPSTLKFDAEAGMEHPEVVDQLTRLEILNLLAMLQDSRAERALVDFLQNKNWGVTGVAAALMLTEGDAASTDLIKQLLTHSVSKVRIQAALILSLWGRGEDAIAVLRESYPKADRELKERILEGIGRIGAPSSIPFLVDSMQESSQALRIIAASALLQSLYH